MFIQHNPIQEIAIYKFIGILLDYTLLNGPGVLYSQHVHPVKHVWGIADIIYPDIQPMGTSGTHCTK